MPGIFIKTLQSKYPILQPEITHVLEIQSQTYCWLREKFRIVQLINANSKMSLNCK
jgi:hypothetical protein